MWFCFDCICLVVFLLKLLNIIIVLWNMILIWLFILINLCWVYVNVWDGWFLIDGLSVDWCGFLVSVVDLLGKIICVSFIIGLSKNSFVVSNIKLMVRCRLRVCCCVDLLGIIVFMLIWFRRNNVRYVLLLCRRRLFMIICCIGGLFCSVNIKVMSVLLRFVLSIMVNVVWSGSIFWVVRVVNKRIVVIFEWIS